MTESEGFSALTVLADARSEPLQGGNEVKR